MSILKELGESHEFVKTISTNIFLVPFWYVAIYLFNNEFYIKADTVIIITMCIVLSVTSSFISTLIFSENNNDKKVEEQHQLFFNAMSTSILFLCFWLILLTIIFYSLGFLFKIYIYFYWFLVIYTLPIAFMGLLKIISKEPLSKTK